MLVVIAFESMFGNTRQVAEAVAAGIADGRRPPLVVNGVASRLGLELIARADLLVVGGPTHYRGIPTRDSVTAGRQLRRRAVLTGHLRPGGIEGPGDRRPGHDRRAGPGDTGTDLPDVAPPEPAILSGDGNVDLRAWLRALPQVTPGHLGAAFDTRVTSRWAGGAAYAIARRLRRHGYDLAVPPEGYVIDGLLGPLRAGEADRARRWGALLRRRLAP